VIIVNPYAADVMLLLARLGLGLTLAAHGYGKFFRGGKIAGTARWFDSMGMRPGKMHALLAATTELGGGLMMAAGLLTPLAGAAFVGLMIVAGYTDHRKNGFFIVKQGWEYNWILALFAVMIATLGPRHWSLDYAIGVQRHFYDWFGHDCYGWMGMLVSSVVGIVVGVGTLVVFYRPPADD